MKHLYGINKTTMETYPLLQSQLGVLLQSMQHPESTQYNLPNYIFMPLSMTQERVASTVRTLIDSFPELRTRFVVGEQGEVRQWSDPSMSIPVVSRKCTEAELQTYISDGFVRPFSPFDGEPLFRVEVVETEKHLCLLSDGYHAIVDGMSFAPILTTAFATIFEGGNVEPQPYGMYQAAEDEGASFGTEVYQRAKAYYAGKFAGLEMATLSHAKPGTIGQMERRKTTVSRSVCDDWCRVYGLQPNLLFQAAFCHVMSVLTRQEKVAYSTVNHGRMDKRLRGSVGMFVKSVPMLADVHPSQRVIDFVRSQRAELISTIRYAAYPFTHFCSDLQVKPGVTFNFMAVANMEEHVTVDGVEVRAVQPVRNETDSDLSVDIYLKGEDYEMRVESSLAMNDADTLQMVAEAMRVAVCNMTAHPELTLGELDIVSDGEREALITLGRGKSLDIDPQMTFVKAFERCASQHPDRLAVADATNSMTYGELSRRSDVLAQRLIAYGVRPNDFVAVMLDRTIDFPLAVIAIHKAGAAYVPIDLEYPEERQQYMLSDCEAKVVIDKQFLEAPSPLPTLEPPPNLPEGRLMFSPSRELEGGIGLDGGGQEALAYMIYTSGSTGKPKGAVLHQAGLWNVINAIIDIEHLTTDDRISIHRSFSFDAHVEDLFPILTIGGSLHIMPEDIRKNLAAIRDFLFEHQITGGGYATAIATLLLDTYQDLPMRFIASGGEKLDRIYSDHIGIINFYGPTECTCNTSFYVIEPGCRVSNIPIGQTVANCYHFITDTQGRLLPRGAVGELCFAGIQVGCGYWRQPELTAEKFCDCPFLPTGADGMSIRMYKTGDLCRWNDEGMLEFIGRQDNQVKLHGYRIELGEIESCARRFVGIGQAVAVVRPIKGSDTLCLYYTADSNTIESDLRDHLSQSLANYMVPAICMRIDAMPLTPNGKVDRRRLPEPKLQQEAVVAPDTEQERQLFAIVAEQLGTTDFGVTTNLVSLGLSSLDAMRLCLTIGKQTGLTLTVSQLLEHPTVRQMAKAARRPSPVSDLPPLTSHPAQDCYPLTANQRGVYIDWELNRDATQYNVPMAICLGQTDANKLADVLRQVVDKHSYIKTRLARHDGSVVQLRRDDAAVPVSVSSLDREPDRDFFQQRVLPFNLFTDDLYRIEVYTCGGRTWLFKDFHHIVTDGLSDAIFFRDLLAALHGTRPKRDTVTAFDYALYEQDLSSTNRYAEARDYFDRLLDGAEAASYPHTASGTAHCVGSVTATVADSEAVRKACRRMGITPNSYFQTVLAQVLHRLTRQEHLMLATVTGGRSLPQTENMMGMLVRTLPLVSVVGDTVGTTFATVAQTIHRQGIESMSRDFYPLTEMVERYGLHPEILYAFEGGIYDPIVAAFSPDTDVIVPTLDMPKLPIEVTVYPDRQGDYTILLNYDSALYSHASMAALASALTCCATSAAKEGVLLSDIELTTGEQRTALVALGAGKPLDIDPQLTFVKVFERCASQHPDRLAVADAHDRLTYGELSRRSDVLAHRLMADGVRPNDFVAVMLDRTIAFPTAVIAIHKAGAAYVPIDLEYPEERQRFMLDDCEARTVIDDQYIAETDFSQGVAPIDQSSSDGLAYMIYTSGSTGRPKGVMLGQRGLCSYIASMTDVLGLTASDRISLHRPFSFDAHIQDLYPVLTIGGSLHIMPSEIRRDIQGMRDFITVHGITGGSYTTSLGKLLIESGPLSLRYMTLTGERMADMVSGDVQLFNGYGPTECTDLISAYRLERGRTYTNIPIGRPMANSHCFIVDAQGSLLPRGAEGELCFASVQVSTGYWHQPQLTAEKFGDCPFLPTGDDGRPVRMYHTGDLCRWNDEGQIEFIGRIDNQVKLRGYRIELGEIESCATRYKDIKQAVAAVRPVCGSDTLCLYYTADDGTTVDAGELRRFLSSTLAEYMVPTAYMQIDALPLTPSGKVDRRHLPEPAFTAQKEYVTPQNKAEETIARLLGDVLSWQKPIGMTDNFFSLGGDSIKLIHLVSLLSGEGYTAQVSELMRCNTVREMARTLVSSSDGPAIPQEPVTGAIKAGAFQRRFLSWQLAQPGRFIQSMVLRMERAVDPALIREALHALAVHHDMLRATVVDGTITIRPTTAGHLVAFQEETLPSQQDVVAATTAAATRQAALIDLEHGPILRATLLHADDGDRLLMVCHHIAVDGVSWRILADDLRTAMTQIGRGQAVVLPRKTHSFAYWTATVSRYRDSYLLAAEKPYWQQVQGLMESVELTTTSCQQLRQLTVTMEGEPLQLLLTQSARAYNTVTNDLLLTALCQSYHRLTGNDDLPLQIEGHGREPLHEPVTTDRTVGWFTALYPIVVQGISGDVGHDVRTVKELLRNVPNKGIGYGILQYVESAEGDPMLRTDLTPLVGFNYLGEVADGEAEIVFTEPVGGGLPSVDVNCAIVGGRFVARFGYDAARWTDDEARLLADGFVDDLARVATLTAQATDTVPTASDYGATGWTDEQLQAVKRRLADGGGQLQRVYPLSPMQEGILTTCLSDRYPTAYRLLFRLRLSTLPTEAALRHVLDYLAAKHDVLRTAIVTEGVPQPCQAITDRRLGVEMLDLTGESDAEAAAAAIHREMLCRKLNLTDAPLFQLVCMKTGESSCQLLIVTHHIIMDGWCIPIVFRDLLTKLDAETAGKPLPATTEQNGRYEAFVRQLLRRDRKAGLAYWRNLLEGYDSRAALPAYGHPAEREAKPIVSRKLDESLMASLRGIATGSGVTLNTVVELCWGLALQTFCRTDDVVFLRVVSGRDGRDSRLVGLLINSVPVRVRADRGATVRQALKELQEQSAQSAACDFCPLTEILSQTQLGSKLYQSVLAFENYPLGDALSAEAAHRWNIEPVQTEEEPFGELSVVVSPEADETLRLTFTYDASLYNRRQMEQVAETYVTLLRGMADRPDGQLSDLPLVDTGSGERAALVALGAGKRIDTDPTMTFVKAFEHCADRHPNCMAVADGMRSMTYRELSRRTDALAQRLMADGVKPGDFVAVMLDRTIAFPMAVIAIHKAGAAYVPIDLEYPEERQRFMLSDCEARIVVDDRYIADAEAAGATPVDLSTADGPAYMIYTSGSTGKPRGAVLHQAGLWNFINVVIDMERLTADDRISSHRSFSFDAHIEDLFPILTVGGSLHIMPDAIRLDLAAIRDFLTEHRITGGGYATPVATLLLNAFDDLPVRFMTAGGEKLAGVYSDHVEIINVYGPTECTDDTSYYRIPPGCRVDNIPIGQTVANCYHFIVDRQGRLMPRGAVGELCFAGVQVGKGYWHQPELTAEKFGDCPFLPSGQDGLPVRMYRTGDLCRWNDEGQLEFIGRQDDQVKLRGYRIELGEIEACATRCEGVGQAVAVIRPVQGTDTLCLYYTADDGNTVDADGLRQTLSRQLAEYMVPSAYMQMDVLPLTPNGKVDRRRLPEPALQHASYVAPRNEMEKLIVSGFEKVLNQEKISVNDDFVLLGGDSLDALKLVFSLGKTGITVADVLSLRTPAAIAGNVQIDSVNLNRYTMESGCPLNNTQVFIFQDIVKFSKYDSYLIPSLIPIDRKYTDEQIRTALDVMFTAHPVLTMHVAMRDGVPYMERGGKPAVMKGSLNPLKILSLLTSGFDLYSSLSRHVIVRIPGRCYLLSVFHHLIFDQISHSVFYRHFQRALEGESLDFVDDHFLKVSSFHQEVKNTEQYAEMDKHIRAMLGNLSEANFYRNPGKPGKPGYHMLELGVDREQVNRFTGRFGITKNILFTAAMAKSMSKLAGSDDVAFGFLDNGRDRFNNFEDVGLYITGMPIVAHVDHHDMQAFLDGLSSVYYELSQHNYFPFASLAQEFNIAPIILFQFFPEWITENGKYNHFPKNETLINAVLSTQKDFMVEALVDVDETKDGYVLRVTYSGYYSRKMMKVLATTYKETITLMLKS